MQDLKSINVPDIEFPTAEAAAEFGQYCDWAKEEFNRFDATEKIRVQSSGHSVLRGTRIMNGAEYRHYLAAELQYQAERLGGKALTITTRKSPQPSKPAQHQEQAKQAVQDVTDQVKKANDQSDPGWLEGLEGAFGGE